jgi:hypothetical protein
MTKKLTRIEKAMRKIQDARNLIRDEIKAGGDVDGHLERFMDETTKQLDILDSVNEEHLETIYENDDELVSL